MSNLSEEARVAGALRVCAWTLMVSLALLIAASGCEQSGDAGAPADPPVVAAPTPSAPAVLQAADEKAPPGRDPRTSIANRPPPELTPTAGAARQPTTRPASSRPLPIELDPPVLDFGYIPPGVDSTGTISIRNVGTDPVTITLVRPTCKCTTLNNLAGVVIGPEESVPLTAQLEGRSMAGPRKAAVRITFEGYDQVLSVDVRAEVTLLVRATPSIFNLATGQRTGHVVVASVDGRPFNILAANRRPPQFVGFDPAIDEPRSSYTLQWDLTAYADEELPRWWIIETDHPECPLLDAWVRHRATIEIPPRAQTWRLADRRVVLGLISPGSPVEFTTVVRDIGNTQIYAVRSLSAVFDAELVRFEYQNTDGVCTVRITPEPQHRGLLFGRVEFIAQTYSQKLDVVGKVVE